MHLSKILPNKCSIEYKHIAPNLNILNGAGTTTEDPAFRVQLGQWEAVQVQILQGSPLVCHKYALSWDKL